MDMTRALSALAALSQETRLAAFRLLVAAGHDGVPAGEIAGRLGVRPNTLSTHLGLLARSGLVRPARDGRSIRYSADFARMRDLLAFLVEDCCNGRPEICAPLAEVTARCIACADDAVATAAPDGSRPHRQAAPRSRP